MIDCINATSPKDVCVKVFCGLLGRQGVVWGVGREGGRGGGAGRLRLGR